MKVFTIFAIFLAFFIIDPLGLVEPAPVPPTPTPVVQSAPAVDAYPGPTATDTPDAYPAEDTRLFPTPPPGPKPTLEGEPCDECGPKGGR